MNIKCKYILERIKENISLQEITKELNIPYQELFSCLKKIILSGYDFDKQYFSNGDIIYNLKKDNDLRLINDKVNINMKKEEKEFRAVFVSDFHIGHINDRIDLLYDVYNYAINRQINIIIMAGDIIENTYSTNNLRLKTVEEQIDCLIKEYPCDKKITNFSLYGNHDFYSLKTNGLNIANKVSFERPDIVNLGYGQAIINLKNDCIKICHDISPRHNSKSVIIPKLTFLGHSHMAKVKIGKKNEIYLPGLTDAIPSNYGTKPLKGFIDSELYFNDNDQIEKAILRNFVIANGINLSNETTIQVRTRKKDLDNE